MNGKAVTWRPQADDEPELNLVLAVIERAKRDAAYKPGPGVKRRTITPEDQKSAQSFLRDLQSKYEASGASVKY